MTQSRSSISILLALAVLMIAVVESQTQPIDKVDKVDNVVDMGKGENQTQYPLDIQTNFIDSEIVEGSGNDINEAQPVEPIVIDLEHQNITIPKDIGNATTLNANLEINVKNEVPTDEISTPEVQESRERTNEINETVENMGQTLPAVQLKTTAIPILDETISITVPITGNKSFTDNTLATVDTTHFETQTQSIEIHQATSTNYDPKKLHDLSIYFENEPSRARQLRGFNKETDNEVMTHNDPGSELDSSSNISNSELEISHSSDMSSGLNENKPSEDSSTLEDLSNEEITAEQKAGSPLDIQIEETAKSDSVEVIETVTESTGDITNDVTVVANEEPHTIMKKPGVDDELPKNTSVGSTQDQTNEIDAIVNLVINRSKKEMYSSATTVALTENQSSHNKEFSKSTIMQLEDVVVPVTEKSSFGRTQLLVVEETSQTQSLPESKILDKSKVNKTGVNAQISLPELQTSFKPHPENASSQRYDEPISGLNVIPYSDIHDDNLLIDNIEHTTNAPSVKTNEPSLLEGIQEDQPMKKTNGIFKEIKADPRNFAEEFVETSTEKPIGEKFEGPIKAPLDENQIETITDHITPEDSLQTTTEKPLISVLNDKTSFKLNEDTFPELNSIPHFDPSLSADYIEISTQSSPVNRFESEALGDVQEDLTINKQKGILKEPSEVRLSPTDESLPDPKLYEEPVETSTERPTINKIDDPSASLEKNQYGTTTDYARHVDSLQTMRDESSSVVSDEVIAPASVGRSINEIIAEGLGKPLPTRSVGDEPSSSSYSSEDKTTTVLVLCAAAGGIFVAFSLAIYLISFQRQHGTLDIEMQEQQCGKDNLEDDDDDSETRVSLLNQIPTIDSDEHSSD